MSQWDEHLDKTFEQNTLAFNEIASTEKSLGRRVEMLHAHQKTCGFLASAPAIRLHWVISTDGKQLLHLLECTNRDQRHRGTGRPCPHPALAGTKDGQACCFLCRANIRSMQRGIQIPLAWTNGRREYMVLASPFPFAEAHCTVASREHEPQTLDNKTVEDLYALARQLNGFSIIYNGKRAGASIPRHRHLQCFRRGGGDTRMPIEGVITHEQGNHCARVDDDRYPLCFFRLSGGESFVVEGLISLCEQWRAIEGESATENVLATNDAGIVTVYYIPRTAQRRFKGLGLPGEIGTMECAGQWVVSSDEERNRLANPLVRFDDLHARLRAVRPAQVARLQTSG
jgi:hypothetical protein